jgi:hypothetical protein
VLHALETKKVAKCGRGLPEFIFIFI